MAAVEVGRGGWSARAGQHGGGRAGLLATCVALAGLAGPGFAQAQQSDPRVIAGRNGEMEVIFAENDCIVYFDSSDRQTAELRDCRRAQVERAASALAQQRRRERRQARQEGQPRVVESRDGEREVIFPNGCRVFYDRRSQHLRDGDRCRGRQRERADAALAQHRIDQVLASGRGRVIRDAAPGRPELISTQGGLIVAAFLNKCVLTFDREGREIERLPQCGKAQATIAEREIARYREELQGSGRRRGR